MEKLNLSVLDRLMLPQLLPAQGGKIEMLLAISIATKVEFSPAEISEFGLKDSNGSVSWTDGREAGFEFTPEQVEILKSASKRADDEKKITRQNLALIVKIDSL